MNHIDKWSTIHSTVRNEHIAILALQETHLDDDRLNDINRCFGRNFEITNTGMSGNPRTTAGVAIILNKAMIAPTSVKTYVLKQGRALVMRIKWADAGDLTILNIYAPNERRQHPTFWAELEEERIDQRMPKPDLILGDFNVTEDGIDRSPPQENERAATDALRNIRLSWGVQDQWRHDNPSERLFTHKHLNNGKHEYARLDRIYSKRELANKLFDWKAKPSLVPTDHWLVAVKFAPKDAPLIGGGRWTWPLNARHDDPLIEKIIKKGIQAQIEIEEITNTPTEN